MRRLKICTVALAAVIWTAGLAPVQAAPWVEVDPAVAGMLDGDGRLLGAHGEVLTDNAGEPLVPSCALGALSPTGPFRFFTQAGDVAKLLIVHDGGGACWESNTCGTVLDPNPDPARSVFDPLITERAEDLPLAGGVFDDANTANPFRGWTKVYVPYCTGDIGWATR